MLNRVGDGSKTACLIFQKILDLGSLALKRNHPPGDLLRGMDRAIEAIVASIRAQTLLIIAEDVEGEALATLIVNRQRDRSIASPSRHQDTQTGGEHSSKTLPC